MEFGRDDGKLEELDVDLLVVGVRGDEWAGSGHAATLDSALGGLLKQVGEEEGFEGKNGQALTLHTHSKIAARRVLLLGLPKDDPYAGRTLAARAARRARQTGLKSLGLVAPEAAPDAAALMLGARLGFYAFDKWRTRDIKEGKLERVLLVDAEGDATAQDVGAVADGVTLARDLVNEPPVSVTPTVMAETAKTIAKDHGLECTIFDKAALEKKGMRLILAVSAGSSEEPRLIHLTYRPKGATADTPSVALVGKGITFDAGGLCLKPTGAIEDMKLDMGGGAAVLGAMKAIGALKPEGVIVHGIVPSSENLLGEAAFKPGDVFRSYKGTTVEILNTDAEGRLILADALHYAVEQGAREIIDLATLTGAICVALGNGRCGLFANQDAIAEAVQQAADAAGEPYWRMPLDRTLKKQLKSDTADLKNVGKRWGGAITAALFLEDFVTDTAWVHLDIAGPAFSDKSHDHVEKGGTGFGVMTLVEYVRRAASRLS